MVLVDIFGVLDVIVKQDGFRAKVRNTVELDSDVLNAAKLGGLPSGNKARGKHARHPSSCLLLQMIPAKLTALFVKSRLILRSGFQGGVGLLRPPPVNSQSTLFYTSKPFVIPSYATLMYECRKM